jgi:flagellar basal-body rod protein FlgG
MVMLLCFVTGCAASGGKGNVTETGRDLDIAIDGDGYFVVETGHGGYLFTRDGAMFVSADAYLVNKDGYRFAPPMHLATDAHLVKIEPDGRVSFKREGDISAAVAGYLKLARFPNASKLMRDGVYFVPTEQSGDPITARPGSNGVGKLRLGALEK